MHKEPPIAEYTFSWGKMFRLYPDYLDVNGTHYPLSKLTNIYPIYRHVMGISSLRLELCFGGQKVVLRGIAALGGAQKTLEYLNEHYLHRAQTSPEESVPQQLQVLLAEAASTPAADQQIPGSTDWPPADQQLAELAEPPEPGTLSWQDLSLRAHAQAQTAKIAAPNWQRFRQDQRERRLKRIQIARALREYGFDIDKLAQQLNEDVMPEVSVSVRLLPGEHAHYSTDATLCGEPIGNALRYTYPARDHGTLILTNKRLIYIGRTSQIVLDYVRLSHVCRLRGAIAFQAEHWYRREIFEVRRALECIMHLEAILKRFQREQEFEAITSSYFNPGEREDAATTPFVKTELSSLS